MCFTPVCLGILDTVDGAPGAEHRLRFRIRSRFAGPAEPDSGNADVGIQRMQAYTRQFKKAVTNHTATTQTGGKVGVGFVKTAHTAFNT